MTQIVSPEITETHARKIVELLGHGLVNGIGVQEPGKMCVEAAVCYALGLPHSDDPGCVSPALRQLKIGLNDSRWSSPMARADGLKRLALVQLGSKGVLDDREFVRRVVDVTIRRAVPVGLRAAARANPAHAVALEACAVRCEQEGTRESCDEARRVARAAAAYVAAYAADAAAYAAAYADAAAAAAAADAAADDADARARDRALGDYAVWVVRILIDMNAPGCQWLDLTPLPAMGRAS